MKKIYINPKTEVVEIHASNLMQIGSPNGTDVKSGSASSSYEVLSREGRFFDDDEDF